jgi:hypothetical protein
LDYTYPHSVALGESHESSILLHHIVVLDLFWALRQGRKAEILLYRKVSGHLEGVLMPKHLDFCTSQPLQLPSNKMRTMKTLITNRNHINHGMEAAAPACGLAHRFRFSAALQRGESASSSTSLHHLHPSAQASFLPLVR